MKLLSGIQSTFVRLKMLRNPLSSRGRKNTAANTRVAPMASNTGGNGKTSGLWAGPTHGAEVYPPMGSSAAAAVPESGDMRTSWQGAVARLSLQGGIAPPPLPVRGTSPEHHRSAYGDSDDDDDDDDEEDDANDEAEGDDELMAVACMDGAVRASLQSRKSGQYRSLGERVSIELVGLVPDHDNGGNDDGHGGGNNAGEAAAAAASADGPIVASTERKGRMREVILGSVETSLRSLLRQSLRGSAEQRSTSADGIAAAAAAGSRDDGGESATAAVGNSNSSYRGGLMLEVPPEEATALALAAMRASVQGVKARKRVGDGGEVDGNGDGVDDDDDDNEDEGDDAFAEPLRWALQFDALLEADHSSAAVDPDADDVVEGAHEPVLLPAFANEPNAATAAGTRILTEGAVATAALASTEELFRVPLEDAMVGQRAKIKASQARAKELVRRRNQRNLSLSSGGSSTGVSTTALPTSAHGVGTSASSLSSSAAVGMKSKRIPAWRSPERAAACLQALWRGWWERVRTQRQQVSAVCLQRFWRGWQQRQVSMVHSEVAAKARRVAAAHAARGHRRQVLEAELDRLKSTTVSDSLPARWERLWSVVLVE